MKKIIFIINSIQQQRCIKRIEEFIAQGYEIEAYGFNRAHEIPTLPQHFHLEVIGRFENSMNYIKRMYYMYSVLKPIFKRHENENVIYYYFLLDVAMIGCLLSHKPYIYEESDLMQTYLPKCICKILDRIDKKIISRSLLTTMTSEGFIQYHFSGKKPNNVVLVPNRLNSSILSLSYKKSTTNINHLRIGFVGSARYESIVRFTEVFLYLFPQHEMHFFGLILDRQKDFERIKNTYNNVYFHGKFSNPQDLPAIYQKIDLVLATYDNKYENVRYAEPNKLYEAAYFETPIIVSKNTFLASKVEQLGIGFPLDPMDSTMIKSFVNSLTLKKIEKCVNNCRALNKESLINNNPSLFEHLQVLLSQKY